MPHQAKITCYQLGFWSKHLLSKLVAINKCWECRAREYNCPEPFEKKMSREVNQKKAFDLSYTTPKRNLYLRKNHSRIDTHTLDYPRLAAADKK